MKRYFNKKSKLILKVLFILAILMLGIKYKDIYAYNITYYAKREDDGCLHYTTYTAAYSGEVANYSSKMNDNGKKHRMGDNGQYYYGGWKNAYWVNKSSSHLNKYHTNTASFRGVATIYHTEPLSSYEGGNNNYGYSIFKITNNELNYKKMVTEINNLTISSKTVSSIKSKDNYYQYILYGIGFGNRDTGAAYSTFTSNATTIKNNLKKKGFDYGYIGYRFGIVAGKDTNNKQKTDNIYIDYLKLNPSQLDKLIDAVEDYNNKNNNALFENGNPYVWFSDINERGSSTAYNYYMVTAHEFMNTGWGNSTKGIASGEKAIGSGLNLYDNKLILPQIEKQTLLIQHIDIDTNTTISTDIVDNSPKITQSYDNDNKGVYHDSSYIQETTGDNYKGYGYFDAYEDSITYGEKITIQPLTTTTTRQLSNGKYVYKKGYKCIGYNFKQDATFKDAYSHIRTQEKNRSFQPFSNGNITITNAKTVGSKKFIVVNIYYSTYEQDVKLKNVLINESDNKVYGILKTGTQSNLVPEKDDNKELYTGKVLKSISNSAYEESYKKPLNRKLNILKETSDIAISDILDRYKNKNVVQEDIKYLGYKIFNTKANYDKYIANAEGVDVGNLIEGKPAINNLPDGGGHSYIVCFYALEANELFLPIDVSVGGKLEVGLDNTGNNKYENICERYFSVPATVKDVITKLKFGVTEIPRTLIKGIELKKTEQEVTVYYNFKYRYKQNGAIKTSEIQRKKGTLTFEIEYYKINNLMITELENVTIYTPGHGIGENTAGNILFNKAYYQIKPILNNVISCDITSIPNIVEVNIQTPIDIIKSNGPTIPECSSNDFQWKESEEHRIFRPVNNTDLLYNYESNPNFSELNNLVIKKIEDGTFSNGNISTNDAIEMNYTTYKVQPIKIGDNTLFNNKVEIIAKIATKNYDGNKPIKHKLKNSTGDYEIDTIKPITGDSYTQAKNYYINSLRENMSLDSYNNNSDNVIKDALNGIRKLSSEIKYINYTLIKDGNKIPPNSSTHTFNDNFYHMDKNKTKDAQDIIHYSNIDSSDTISKRVEASDLSGTNVDKYSGYVNIYTPITVKTKVFVHDEETNLINPFEEFKIRISTNPPNSVYKGMENSLLKKYSYGYYIKFDFDVIGVKINGKVYKNGEKIPAKTWIGVIGNISEEESNITAKNYYSETGIGTFISANNNSYEVRAVAMNTPHDLRVKSLDFKLKDNSCSDNSITPQCSFIKSIYNVCSSKGYFDETTSKINAAQLLYDFRVTDVKDINFKAVFRNTSTNSSAHKGTIYYSGIKETSYENGKDTIYTLRKTSQIGSTVKKILPLGPYKNTDTSYIKAPKIGYRFSFDMKLTGDYNKDSKIEIEPTFYYISKTGEYNSILEEYSLNNKGIYLFYKNAEGKYVRIGSAADTYQIYYTPKDVYRYIGYTTWKSNNLSNKSTNIGSLKKITLLSNISTIETTNGGLCSFYGEYKLPNSTVAVVVDSNGKYDINKPLTNGYIGVKFNIVAKNSSGSEVANYNSQWKKEGYLGYDITKLSYTLKLEKGTLTIDTDEKYNKIVGTVMLYDLDLRADTDFE